MATAVSVWDFVQDRLVFLKIVSDDESTELADNLAAKYYKNPPGDDIDQYWIDALWIEDERYEIIEYSVVDDATIVYLINSHRKWKDSFMKNGMPSNEI